MRPTAATLLKTAKSQKVVVQLLRDVTGLGSRGEVLRVAAGRMRNELHVGNKAYYVVKSEPLRIPQVHRQQIELAQQKLRDESEARRLAQEKLEAAERAEQQRQASAERFKYLTNLDFSLHSGPEASPASTASAAYLLNSAVQSLPQTLTLRRSTKDSGSGYLAAHLTTQDLAAHLSTLAGSPIPASSLTFTVHTDAKTKVPSHVLDHIGRYKVTIETGAGQKTVSLAVEPQQELAEEVARRRPFGPLPESTEANKTKAEANKPKTDKSEAKSEAKTFDWENDILSDLQSKLRN